MKYEMIVKCGNNIGLGWLETIVDLANQGATLKEGVRNSFKFPHICWMEIEAEEDPIATPFIRVFREDKSEVAIIKQDQEFAAKFSLDVSDGKRLTKEQLDSMEWKAFKALLKLDNITGRDRKLMTTQYLQVE